MLSLQILPARLLGSVAVACGVAIAPLPAIAEFVVNDRLVSDPGVNLPNPSFDQITNTMVWQDTFNKVWMAKLDPISGDINPWSGKSKLLDDNAANSNEVGNSVMFANGDGLSNVIWTRNLAGIFGLGEAVQNSKQAWKLQDVTSPLYRSKPEGTHANWFGPPKEAYNFVDNGKNLVAIREVGNPASERAVGGATIIPGQGGRWIEGENSILAAVYAKGGVRQVATIDFNLPDPKPVQVTFEAEETFNAYSWIAPEFNGPVFSAMIGSEKIGIFRKAANGSWENFYTFTIPSKFKYVSSPEGFVWNGKSYLFAVAASDVGVGPFPYQPVGPSQIWIAGIDPANPFFRRIDDHSRLTSKAEPEVYVTASGPQIYYGEKQPNGNWAQRIADTGLGADWGYDNQFYSGPWASPFRDNKNCSCTPFPVGDGYQEMSGNPPLRNQQWMRQIMGPEGNLYAPLASAQGGWGVAVGAYATATATEVFRVSASDVDAGLIGSNGLVTTNGSIFLGGNTRLTRYTNNGTQIWSAPIRGLAQTLQFAPNGNLLAFSFNGWFQTFSPDDGRLLGERNLTPWRSYPEIPSCGEGASRCAYLAAPAVDMRASRVYVSYTSETATGSVQGYAYDSKSHVLTKLWESAVLASGSIGSPVLSADYSRLYVQSKDGKLFAIDAATGAVIWKFDLMISALGTPVVTEFGYIVPGTRQSDSSTVNYVGIVKDTGASAQWAFQTTDFAAQSLAAAGRGNRFVLMARRYSDNALVLLVIHPKFGVISQTPMTIGPQPARLTGIIIDQSGWIFAGTSGSHPYRAFRPTYATTVQ